MIFGGVLGETFLGIGGFALSIFTKYDLGSDSRNGFNIRIIGVER